MVPTAKVFHIVFYWGGGEVGKQILNVSCVAASFDFQRKTLTIEEWSWLYEQIYGKGSPSTQFVSSQKWNNNIVW